MTRRWQEWDVSEWSEACCRYFFRKRYEGDEDPVRSLIVNATELGRAAEASRADAEAAKERLVDVLRTRLASDAVRKGGSTLCADAMRCGAWSPGSEGPPPFVAHLVLTCLAASECSDEDLASEGAYQRRLNQLAGDHVNSHDPFSLPELWERLAAWLDNRHAAGEEYRTLELPERGGFRRIGYSVRLTFPHHSDQRRLLKILESEGLRGLSALPVEQTLQVLRRQIGHFRPRFQDNFDEFEASWARGEPDLDRHPFSYVLSDVALYGAVPDEVECARFAFVLDPHPDQFEITLMADDAARALVGPTRQVESRERLESPWTPPCQHS